MKKGILFDLDGTLWDSSAGVVEAWNTAIRKLGIDYHVTVDMMHGFMGKTMDAIAYELFDREEKEKALEYLTVCTDYENEYLEEHGGILYEGLEETLEKLHKDHFLAVVSNCQEGYIEAFIKYHKLEKYFDDTENYGRTGKGKADNIRLVVERNHLDKAVYVGDIMGDYNSTMEAGLPFIHAAYGFGTVPEGTPFINDIRDLPALMEDFFA